jgi:DNA-directed RNA polymerase subunit RPC12/RpoP
MSKLAESMYDYRYEREEPKPAGVCNSCGDKVYIGEEVYKIDNKIYCEDCVEKVILEEEI